VLWVFTEELSTGADTLPANVRRLADFADIKCNDKLLSLVCERASDAYMHKYWQKFVDAGDLRLIR
jgi:hypothetical protein